VVYLAATLISLSRRETKRSVTTVNVRYKVDDVEATIAFYTTHLSCKLISKILPAFADVALGGLRLLLSGGDQLD
jgi:catechol 2,3-dioxygenase-like lactoylglutathione lyase family enzyme